MTTVPGNNGPGPFRHQTSPKEGHCRYDEEGHVDGDISATAASTFDPRSVNAPHKLRSSGASSMRRPAHQSVAMTAPSINKTVADA